MLGSRAYFSSIFISSAFLLKFFFTIIAILPVEWDITLSFSIILSISSRVVLACVCIRNSQRILFDQVHSIKMPYLGNLFIRGDAILFMGYGYYCYLAYFISLGN